MRSRRARRQLRLCGGQRRARWADKRNILIGELATLLIVSSFGVLFAWGMLPGAPNTSMQKTATKTQTPRPSATATPVVESFPYKAQAPGLTCDPNYFSWQLTGTQNIGQTQCTGAKSYTRMVAIPNAACPGNCATQAQISYDIDHGIPLPNNTYTISVQITGLSDNAEAYLILEDLLNDRSEIEAYATTDEGCAAKPCVFTSTGNSRDTIVRYTTPSSTHTLAINIAPSLVTFLFDGKPVGTSLETNSPIIKTVLLGAHTLFGPTTIQVDFSNFAIDH